MLSGEDAGLYRCQVLFRNGTVAEPSQWLDLSRMQFFDNLPSLEPCSRVLPQAVREERCALNDTAMPFFPESYLSDDGIGNSFKLGWLYIVAGLSGLILLVLLLVGGVTLCILRANKRLENHSMSHSQLNDLTDSSY